MPRIAFIRRALALAAGIAAATPAAAVVVSGTLSFTATGFGAGAPVDPVQGTIAYSFDNDANFFNAADGATANGAPVHVALLGLNLPGSWTPVLSYYKSFAIGPAVFADAFAIGNAPTTFVAPGSDDWRVAFNDASTAPTFREFTYATGAAATTFATTVGSVTPVPEAPTALLAAAGLTALAARARRRR